jgi:hypothetical protein
VNATTASHRGMGVKLFDYVKPSVGLGLRIMFNKYVRTNINIEIGFGAQSRGMYFSGAETF